jgi:hypothetical protein
MPVRSRQKDEGKIPINSKVEHRGNVGLCLPTCTGGLSTLKVSIWDQENVIIFGVFNPQNNS